MDKTITINKMKFMDTLTDAINDLNNKTQLPFELKLLLMMYGADVATKLFDEDESKEIN